MNIYKGVWANEKAETTNRILKSETEEVILLTQALVRIPSVYRPGEKDGNEERVARFVYNYLKRTEWKST